MKKAQINIMNIVFFGIILLGIMGIALVIAISGGVIKEVLDNTLPALESLPPAGNTNISAYTTLGLAPINTLSDNLGWILGGLYIIALIGTLGIAYGYRVTGQKVLLILFLGISILVILGSILVSQVFQGIYESPGVLGEQLQQMTLFSWLLLYSPIVMIIITFFGGAIIFSGLDEVRV